MPDRVRWENTRRCARAPARFYPAPVFPLRARATCDIQIFLNIIIKMQNM